MPPPRPAALGERGRHEAGAALSFPFGEKVSLGGTIRYLRIRREMEVLLKPKTNGFTFDAGLTVRPVSFVSIGLAGRGLRDMEDPQAPLTLGGGLALTPLPELVVAVDAYHVQVAPASYLVVSGGVEYTVASMLSVRLGGGRMDDEGFGSAGLSVVSEVGALDLGGPDGVFRRAAAACTWACRAACSFRRNDPAELFPCPACLSPCADLARAPLPPARAL